MNILPLGSGSLDPHIFADQDPDPGSQNLADPTDPDPKHCFQGYHSESNTLIYKRRVTLNLGYTFNLEDVITFTIPV